GERRVTREVSIRPLRPGDALQQKMVQAERDVESRVAIPRALRVQEYRPLRTEQDVFRAHVTMHERETGMRGALAKRAQLGCEIRVPRRRRQQIWLEPDRMENRVGAE